MSKGRAAVSSLLSGIILAAGASTRMGRPKQLLPLGDRPLLQHVIDEAAASGLDEIVLVLGHRAEEIQRAIRLPAGRRIHSVVNPEYDHGQSTSLRLGLRSASPRADAAAILLGDQPNVSAQLIDRIAAAFRGGDSSLVRPVYMATDGRRVPGHPVFLARRIWPDVKKLRGDQGARALLSAHPEWLLEVPVEGEPPPDVDTWEDYQRASGLQSTPLPEPRSRTGTM
jgi:molybdenum cofactor cytidylyltransferase